MFLATLHAPMGAEALLVGVILVALVVLWARAINPAHALLIALLAAGSYAIIGSVAMPLAGCVVAVLLIATRRDDDAEVSAWPLVRELALVMGGLALYTTVRRLIEADPEPAFAHARSVLSFEDGLGLYFEPNLQEQVMRAELLTRGLNAYYSFGFLAFVGATLLWLWFRDRANYRLMRNALGISVLLAVATIALYPVAPPRLFTESQMIDTIAYYGREHAFANEFAAIPSLHVGWMALSGYVLARSIGGRRGVIIGIIPGASMAFTVIVTGNHFWVDGLIGAAYSLIPAMAMAESAAYRAAARAVQRFGSTIVVPTLQTVADTWRVRMSMIALGVLLTYLIAAQTVNPGFTNFWGYLVVQVAVVTVGLLAGEVAFAKQGGLSWITHVIAVACCYADVLGTDGNLYANIDEYDKITHFAGVAAVTAFVYDCMRGLRLQGRISWRANERLLAAIAIGIAVGVGWEVYELLGDRVFHTARVNSKWDTINDIVSDTLGAIAIAVALWYGETMRAEEERPALREVD